MVLYRYRVLAELLEQGTRSTLIIPTHAPVPVVASAPAAQMLQPAAIAAAAATAAGPRPLLEVDAVRALGVNPSTALQHPGFYYYVAARATERRRANFLAAVDGEVRLSPSL